MTKIISASQYSSSNTYDYPEIICNNCSYLIEIPISINETQTFLYDRKVDAIILETLHWKDKVKQMLLPVIEAIKFERVSTLSLQGMVILVGVWHFGHMLGDFGSLLLYFTRNQHLNGRRLFSPACSSIVKSLSKALIAPINCVEYNSDSNFRVYQLVDCVCVYPSIDRCRELKILSEYIYNMLPLWSFPTMNLKVFLTSGRTSRIRNIDSVKRIAESCGWVVLNPLATNTMLTYTLVSSANALICENGSILFNCFLSRNKSYSVLCSERLQYDKDKPQISHGGMIYNYFHRTLIDYIYQPCTKIAHHPFSDQIDASIDLFVEE